MICTICPQCQRPLQSPETLANRLVKCPHCQTPFTVSSLAAAPSVMSPASSASSLRNLQETEDELPRRWRRYFSREESDRTDAPGVISLIFGCLAMLCALLGVILCTLSSRSALATLGAIFCYVALPFGLLGGLVGFFGKGNMRVAGLLLNCLAAIPATVVTVIIIGAAVAQNEQEARLQEEHRQRNADLVAEARHREAETKRLRQETALKQQEARLLDQRRKREHEEAERRALAEQQRLDEEAQRKAEQETKAEAAKAVTRKVELERKTKEAAAREAARKAELERKGLPYYPPPVTAYEEHNAQEWYQLLLDKPNDARVWPQATQALVALKEEGTPFLLDLLSCQKTMKDRNTCLQLVQIVYVHPNDLPKLLPCLDQRKAFSATRMLALKHLRQRAKDLNKRIVPEIESLVEDMLDNPKFREETKEEIKSFLKSIRMEPK